MFRIPLRRTFLAFLENVGGTASKRVFISRDWIPRSKRARLLIPTYLDFTHACDASFENGVVLPLVSTSERTLSATFSAGIISKSVPSSFRNNLLFLTERLFLYLRNHLDLCGLPFFSRNFIALLTSRILYLKKNPIRNE